MPYSEPLAARIRSRFARRKGVEEKKMFGRIAFLLNGNMCVGVGGVTPSRHPSVQSKKSYHTAQDNNE